MNDFVAGVLIGLLIIIILLIMWLGYALSWRRSPDRIKGIATANQSLWDPNFNYEGISATVSDDGEYATVKFKITPKKSNTEDKNYDIAMTGSKKYKLTTDFLSEKCGIDCIQV